ncbi:hypothetical protein NKR19_g8944 [Coniochaeta hoffmannii]|uniref:Uncharacterized protein n=1 Tax=Coniochaeta hoffmannii TaxID=91930 RepID=A0AA38RE41_9PEZI|nr:hypothetical protein NKR19_g8944 [Coniochaeta hoffmannii]
MADLAALMLDLNGSASPMEHRTPPRGNSPPQLLATGDSRHGVVTYSYGVTTPEHKQARLDAFRSLGDAYAPSGAVETAAEDVAYYKLMEAYERNDASRKAGEAFADEYEAQCRQRMTSTPPPAKKKQNVCRSCLRPFDDGFYRPGAEQVESAMTRKSSAPESGISFDVELGTWRVHFARNTEQDALQTGAEGGGKAAETKTAPEPPPEAAAADDDDLDGGYVDYYSHLQGNSRMRLPVRTKEEDPQMAASSAPAVALAAQKIAAGDVMADYDAFLRRNHVVVMPNATEAEKAKAAASASTPATRQKAAAGDVMSDDDDYDDYLRGNHVVVVPEEKPNPAAGVSLATQAVAAQAAAAGDVMADYDRFLRSNHVVVVPDKTEKKEEEMPAAEVVVQDDEEEDDDMEYVDVTDEEYLDYLRSNHVVVHAVNKAEAKDEDADGTAKPVVNVKATSYEKFYDFEHHDNVGPYARAPLLRLG